MSRRPELNGYEEDEDPFGSDEVGYDLRLRPEALAVKTGSQPPKNAVVLEGYRTEMANGFEREKPRYNPVSLHPGRGERRDRTNEVS